MNVIIAVAFLAAFSAVPATPPLAATPLRADLSPCFPPELIDFRFAPVEPTGLGGNYRNSISFKEAGHTITRLLWERANASSPWEKSETEYTVSYEITAVAYREGGDVLYVAGIQETDCSDVIERWTFSPLNGSLTLRSALSPTTSPPVGPIGTPSSSLVMVPGVVGTGGYVSPPQRGTPRSPQRRVIYQSTGFGHVRSMAADPEGRFLLVQSHQTSEVYQLNLLGTAPLVPQLIVSPSTIPSLTLLRRIQVYDVAAAGGRAYILSAPHNDQIAADAPWAILKDPGNDGVFDAVQGYSAAEWLASPYSDKTSWTRLIYASGFQLGN